MSTDGRYRASFRAGAFGRDLLAALGAPEALTSAEGFTLALEGELGSIAGNLTVERPVLFGRSFERIVARFEPAPGGVDVTCALRDAGRDALTAGLVLVGEPPFLRPASGRVACVAFAPGPLDLAPGVTADPGSLDLSLQCAFDAQGIKAEGEGRFTGASWGKGPGKLVTGVSGTFGFEDDRIVVKRAEGALRGTPVGLAGWAAPFRDGGAADVNVVGSGFPLTRLFDAQARPNPEEPRLSFSLFLRAERGIPSIAGKAAFTDGTLDDGDLARLRALRASNGPLDLSVRFGPRLKWRNALFDATAEGAIRITSEGGTPAVSGDVNLLAGRLFYLGRTFALDEGVVSISTLASPFPLRPGTTCPRRAAPAPGGLIAAPATWRYDGERHVLSLASTGRDEAGPRLRVALDVRGKTRQAGKSIQIRVTGEPDRVAARFTSEPEMDPESIERLLYGMKLTPSRNTASALDAASPDLVGFLGSQVRSAIWNKIGESLERQLKLDTVSIKADEGRQGTPFTDLEISIGKLVSSDLLITYNKNIVNPVDDSLGMEYKVSRHLFVGGRVDQKSAVAMDARVGFSF